MIGRARSMISTSSSAKPGSSWRRLMPVRRVSRPSKDRFRPGHGGMAERSISAMPSPTLLPRRWTRRHQDGATADAKRGRPSPSPEGGPSMLTLYFAPGASSMAPHIALLRDRRGGSRPGWCRSRGRKRARLPISRSIPRARCRPCLIDGRAPIETAAIPVLSGEALSRGGIAAAGRCRNRGAGDLVDVVRRVDHPSGAAPGRRAVDGGVRARRAAAGAARLGAGALFDRRHSSVPALLALPPIARRWSRRGRIPISPPITSA